MLNDENTGVVMTSIYGRDENRIYLKPIAKGKCDYVLSPEEQNCIYSHIRIIIILLKEFCNSMANINWISCPILHTFLGGD